MKIVRASKLKKQANEYVRNPKHNKFIYAHARGIYDARILGFCIFRNKKAYNIIFPQ